MADLLLELFSEEIPARMQARAAEDLKRLVLDALASNGLAHAAAEAHVTPRRLTLAVGGLPERQPDVNEERKGPRVGSPQPAIDGFLRAAGLASLDEAEQRDTGKGIFYFAVTKREGRPTREVLPKLLVDALLQLPWPKSMRTSDQALTWVRPLHRVLAMLDGEALPGGLDLGTTLPVRTEPGYVGPSNVAGRILPFGTETSGHRFLGNRLFAVRDFADYRAKLREAHVLLDREERKAEIRRQAETLAASAGLELIPDEGLLEEVAGLVEWPVVLMGRIDDAFMEVPPEVLTTSMRTHQKYFALRGRDGRLAPRFLVVANMVTEDGGKTIVAGNERVLRARLSDARFFWDQDRKVALEDRLPALGDIVFHARLGSLAQRVERLETLAGELAPLAGADPAAARRAARLAKADLVTGMVGEFPELQGLMGGYYARAQGETEAVAQAVAEHYAPQGPGDRCPTAPVSVAVALAEKLDTLVGFFGIDEKPTGSKDPYALRRAALGVIRLIVENGLRVPLRGIVASAAAAYAQGTPAGQPVALPVPADLIGEQFLSFLADRLKVALREQGVRHDLIDAVFSLGGEDDLVRLLARVRALGEFLDTEDGANLLVAYRRAANIVRIEERKDSVVYKGDIDSSLFKQPEEQTLHVALERATGLVVSAVQQEQFAGAMTALAALRAPVDAFFDRVTVNADDRALRANRLRLLARIGATMDRVADFSKVEGG